jgi:peptidoglycan/xylan/chitin deacetylase (PgdA/CDA1 family)
MNWLTRTLLTIVSLAVIVSVPGSGKSEAAAKPPWIVAQIAKALPDGVFFKDTDERVVALTIDDVPAPHEDGDVSTQIILNAIAKHNAEADPDRQVTATFFVISSRLDDGSTIIDRIRDQGYEIGNHGTTDATHALMTPEAFEQQMREAHERLAQFTDQPIRWYRPGRGLYTPEMVGALRRMEGYEPRFALASMLPLDTFKPVDDWRFSRWYAQQHIFPGAILVLHGGSVEQSKQTAKALEVILEDLNERDYRVVSLSALWDRF